MVRSKTPKTFNLRKFPKVVWDEFVYGGHFLALGDACAVFVIGIILKIPVTWSLFFVIYFCVFAANLFNRSDESDTDLLTNPIRVRVMKKYIKHFNIIVAACMIASTWLILYFANVWALLFAIFIIIIAMLYTVFLKDLTKYIIGFKNYIAALFYALMVFLLIIYYNSPFNIAVILMFTFYYLRIFISSAACDVKDIEGDSKKGLKTLAIYFGKIGSMRLLNCLNIISGLIIVWGVYANLLPFYSLGLLLTLPYASYYFYLNSKSKGGEFISNVVIDGEFLFWLPYILIGKAMF